MFILTANQIVSLLPEKFYQIQIGSAILQLKENRTIIKQCVSTENI